MTARASGQTVLKARGIHKEFPTGKSSSLKVLKGIDLAIEQGEIVAITGASGVGKSTLLHILGALDRPTRGSVVLDSIDIFSMRDSRVAEIRNRHMGFVFQFHHLLPEFSALENVAMPALIRRSERTDAIKKAAAILREVGLGERMDHKPRELSGGEQQRVAFARSLINEPVIILADEPSGNLDEANSEALHTLMWELVREKGKSFVVVTHNKELAQRADRVIMLSDGKAHTVNQ
jgi:lipoprotein-releasing system ATP-binding protein